MRQPTPGRYRAAIAKLRAERGDRCQCPGCPECRTLPPPRCARTDGLEFAHVAPAGLKGRGRGRAERYHDIKRNPDSYRLACVPCHRHFDRTRTDGHGSQVANFGPDVYAEAEEA